MIITSVETYKKPSFIQPAYSVNGVSVQSDKTGEPSHRFLFDVYVNNVKVGRLKSLPSFNNYTSVEISDIVKNYVESEFAHITPRSVPNDDDFSTKDLYGVVRTQYNFLPKIKVVAGEEYKVGGVLITFNGYDVQGEPEVKVAEWFSTYQAMDANSEQALIGRGGITNNQFQAQHMDVLEFLHQSGQNTFEWFGDFNYQFRTDNLYKSGIWKNYNVRELSNRPLERTLKLNTPSSIGYYEGQHITHFNQRTPTKDVFDNRESTMTRDFNEDPLDMDPLYTTNANLYRQRVHTIGYQYYDPSGLEVSEVRYQPISPIFDQPIKDGFNFDSVDTYDVSENKVSEFMHVNVGAVPEYSKYETNSSTDIINLSQDIDYGDLRNFNTGIGLDYFFNYSGTAELIDRSSVRYREGDKMCEYTPPSYIKHTPDMNRAWFAVKSENEDFGGWEPTSTNSGGFNPTPFTATIPVNTSFPDIRVSAEFYNIPDRMVILDNGVSIYDSGYTSGGVLFDFTAQTNHTYQVRIYRDNPNTQWTYTTYQYEGNLNRTYSYTITPNRFYRLNSDFNAGGIIRLKQNGITIYDSGYVVGPAESPTLYLTGSSITIEIERTLFDAFNFILYAKSAEPISMTLEDVSFNDNQALQPSLMTTTSQISTFSGFVNSDKINNIQKVKNLLYPDDLPSLRTGEHFYIQNEFIIGIDNQLGELYGDRYDFLVAPCLRLWNYDENRWCNQDEVERLTGRALESLNFQTDNGRPVVEVLESTPLNQNENGFDKELSITFRINKPQFSTNCPNVILLPGFFFGVNFEGMATNFTLKYDRLRLVYGTDKSLRNANNYKVNIYDYDNHYNLILDSVANGGKFIYNMNNIVGTPYESGKGVWTAGDTLPYWTYGVNGNYFGPDGTTGTGYLNSFTEQRIGYVLINNIPTTPGEYSFFQSISNAYLADESNLALSYLLKYGQSLDIAQNRFITSEYLEKYGNKIYIQASCMVYVEDTPEAVDLTWISVNYLGIGSGISNQEEIYRAQDKGRWKRIHRTIGVPISQFSNDPSTQIWNQFGLSVNTTNSTDANVWNEKYINIADFRVNFLFEESSGLSERDNAAHKVYTKDLKKINWNKEPHYTFGGDMLRNEAYSLYWMNPYGAWDDYRFTGRSLKTTEVKRESRGIGLDKTGTLNSDAVRLRQNFGDDISYKTNAYETYELTSDYLTQEEREWMEELFISPKHYIYDENKKWFIRVNLLNKEYSTINKNNQKLYQIKIEVQVSSERRTQQVLGSL